jgi:pentatricopeptide repeat protein
LRALGLSDVLRWTGSPGGAAADQEAAAQAPQPGACFQPARRLRLPARLTPCGGAQTPAEKLEIEYRLKVVGCVKDGDAAAALEVYAQMKAEAELTVPAYMYPMVLNVCCNHEQSASFQQGAFEVFQDMKQATAETTAKRGSRRGAGIDETVYSALIKLCSKAKDFAAAEGLITEMEAAGTAPKLRTFAPLLEAFSDTGDLANCEALLATISRHAIPITEAEHVAMLSVCEKNGDADKFYAYLDQFIDDVAQPGEAAWAVLQRWFARCVRCSSAWLHCAGDLTNSVSWTLSATRPRWTAADGPSRRRRSTRVACAPRRATSWRPWS